MWRQVTKLTRQLADIRSSGNDKKSDYIFMINFENQLQSMSRENNFLIKMKIILRLQDDSISFMDWNNLNAIFFL